MPMLPAKSLPRPTHSTPKGGMASPFQLALHQPIDYFVDGAIAARGDDHLEAFLDCLAGQLDAVTGAFGAHQVEAEVILVEELFDVRLGILAVAVPGSWVEDDFVGWGHGAIISADRCSDKAFSCHCKQSVVNLGIHNIHMETG